MSCNLIFREICEFRQDSYGKCGDRVCLVQLFGEREMLRMAKQYGLDKEFPIEYKMIEDRINSERGEKGDGTR